MGKMSAKKKKQFSKAVAAAAKSAKRQAKMPWLTKPLKKLHKKLRR